MTTPGSNGPDQPPQGGAPGWGQPPAGSPGGGYSPPPPPPPGGSTPPPPPGYQPQPGAPQQPPQGSAPYPPQGGAPYPPQGGAPGQQPWAPQSSGRPKWLIPVIAGVVLVAAAVALFAFFGNAGAAEVGDCVSANDANEVEVVDCDDDAAEGKVIGIQDGEQSYSEYLADPDSCSEFADAIASFWQGEEGEDGEVLCVGTV